ncbi:hypothetical protein BH11PLA1_BH11PLA1_03810 [soil metagenome]
MANSPTACSTLTALLVRRRRCAQGSGARGVVAALLVAAGLGVVGLGVVGVGGCGPRRDLAPALSGGVVEPMSVRGNYVATAVRSERGARAITVIGLPIAEADASAPEWKTRFAQIELGSAGGAAGMGLGASGVCASADGSVMFAICGQEATEGGGGAGEGVVVIDMRDPMRPGRGAVSFLGCAPKSIACTGDGATVAAACEQAGAEIALASVGGGENGKVATWSLKDLGFGAGATADGMAFHPSGKFLAVLSGGSREVKFLEVGSEDGEPALKARGMAVRNAEAAMMPSFGKFTEDGKYFVAVSVSGASGGLAGAEAGMVTIIRFDARSVEERESSEPTEPAHTRVGYMPVGIAPTGLALSRDGSEIYVSSARGGKDGGGLISMIKFQPAATDEGLQMVRTLQSVAGLVTGIALDEEAGVLIASVIAGDSPRQNEGELFFYRVTRVSGRAERDAEGAANGATILERAGFRVGVGKSPAGAVLMR